VLAGVVSGFAEFVVLATVCAAMEGRPFLLIFLTTHLAVRRIWHLPEPGASPRQRDKNQLEGCRGFIGPYPSAPLDERCSVVYAVVSLA